MGPPFPKKRPLTKRRGRHPDKALTAAFCRNVAEAGQYADGHGLYLHVASTGARRWVQRLVIRGRPRMLGLGGYPLVSLAEAREAAFTNRKLARAGGDPLAAKRRPQMPTFAEATRTVIAMHRAAWKDGGKTAALWDATLRQYVHPRIGETRVDQVTTADVLAVLVPIWIDKHETARKVRRRISAIMKWAIVQGYRGDNPAGEAIVAALPKRATPVTHMRALPYGEVADAIQRVRASKASNAVKRAFEFLVLTAARSGEVRLATWGEVDRDAATWTVPGVRMKTKRDHRVPLCGRALAILHEARQVTPRGHLIFPSQRGKPLSDMTLSKLIREQGIAAVPHGFRSSFRDWASERTSHPREVIEAALAHAVRSQVEAAYARSDLFERRRRLMSDWAAYLSGQRGQVIPLRR